MRDKPDITNRVWVFVVAFCCVGPLALPLLWKNPSYSKTTKWIVSIFLTLLTLGLIYVFTVVVSEFNDLLKDSAP